MRRISVPGKVMLAGEYAVLEPGNPCLVAAVEKRLFVEAVPADRWSIDTGAVRWTEGDPIVPEVRFVAAVIESLRKEVPPHALRTSDDQHAGGHKLGLGGSAAVTVGALAVLLPPGTERLEIANRALLIHWMEQGGRGSGADIAASAMGGVLDYIRTAGLFGWAAGIQSIHPDVHLDLVWTGTSAKTAPRLGIWSDFVKANPDRVALFCQRSTDAVMTAAFGLRFGDVQTIRSGIGAARSALLLLQDELGLELETEPMRVAAEAVWRVGACSKLSGAGGGDCALVLSVGDRQRAAAQGAVRALGLEVIPVDWAVDGVRDEVADWPGLGQGEPTR